MVDIKISTKGDLNLSSIRAKLKTFEKEFKNEVALEIRKRLLNPGTAEPYVAQVLSILSEMQGAYWGGSGAEDDPTKLTADRYAEPVRAEILKNFAEAAKGVNGEEGSVNLVLLSNDFIGIGMEGDKKGNRPIQWLSYFLVGNLDSDIYWINQEHYEIFHGSSGGDLGRFGVGTLWHITSEEAPLRNAQLKAAGKSYTIDQLKHPQSGKGGKDWFAKAWEAVDFYETIQAPAVNSALERMQSKLFKD